MDLTEVGWAARTGFGSGVGPVKDSCEHGSERWGIY